MEVSVSTQESQKAVSLLVTAMLLILIVIVMSAAFYAYSVGLLGSLEQPPQHGSEMLVIEDIVYDANGSASIAVRNVGSINSRVGSIYVDANLTYSNLQGYSIPVGQEYTFTLPHVWSATTPPTQHNFKVATLNGSVFSTYGPQNIFIAGTFTTTITSGSFTTTKTITTTSTYVTTMGTQTLYSTQLKTTSTSTSSTTITTTSTSLSTSITSVQTYYTTTRTRTRTISGTLTTVYSTSATSTSISTSIITSQSTYADHHLGSCNELLHYVNWYYANDNHYEPSYHYCDNNNHHYN